LNKGENIVKWIKGQRISWLGHLERMEEDRMHKKIFTEELEGTRRRGRPRKGWREEVERDLQVLGVRRWREMVIYREKVNVYLPFQISGSWFRASTIIVVNKIQRDAPVIKSFKRFLKDFITGASRWILFTTISVPSIFIDESTGSCICLRRHRYMSYIIFMCISCNLLTCDMYMCRLRHIHDPVLSSLKMEVTRLLF
jgi:hypothetical protein